MRMTLNRILVVEGKEDVSYLSNYIDSEIVAVNGFELASSTINYLKDKLVILLLDPDEAGIAIRKKIKSMLHNSIDVEVDINKCNRGKKNGVAECELDEIITKLMPFSINKVEKELEITSSTLFKMGLNDSGAREYVCEKLNLGKCNNKILLKRLNLNNVKLDDLNEIIEEYKNGNK